MLITIKIHRIDITIEASKGLFSPKKEADQKRLKNNCKK